MGDRTLVFIENTEVSGMHDYLSLTENEVQLLKFLLVEGYLNEYTSVQFEDVRIPTPIVFGAQTKEVR